MKEDPQRLFFENRYKSKDHYWGTEPNLLTKRISDYAGPGKVLDIGAGDGKDAIFLAEKGFSVTCIDYSETAMKKLRSIAKQFKLKIKCLAEDAREFKYTTAFDVVISFSTLQFMGRNDIIKVVSDMKSHTKPHGINVISAFTERNPYKGFPYLLKKHELKDFYKDWEILYYSEKFTPWERHEEGAPLHRHAAAYIIARKSSKQNIEIKI